MVGLSTFPLSMTRYIPEPNTGCWLWTGAINQDGYGRFFLNRKRSPLVHKYVFEQLNGVVVPPGYEIDHLCFVRSCVNPRHLQLVTQAENKRRAALRRTTCPQGHAYDFVRSSGIRACCTCERAKGYRSFLRIRATRGQIV